jgi:hypothetical protein
MAELSIQRKQRNTMSPAQKVAERSRDNIKAAKKKPERQIGESNLAKDGVVADIIREKLLGGAKPEEKEKQSMGSVKDAIAEQTKFKPKSEKEKTEEVNDATSGYLTKEQEAILRGERKAANDNTKENDTQKKNIAKQEYFRNRAREMSGLNNDDQDTTESIKLENSLQKKAQKIIDELSKYGNITYTDALKILESDIKFKPSYAYKIVLWIWDGFIFLWTLIAGIFAFTGVGIIFTIISGIILWILNFIFNILAFIWERKNITSQISGIEKIHSLK